jgi:hypothetical protein
VSESDLWSVEAFDVMHVPAVELFGLISLIGATLVM